MFSIDALFYHVDDFYQTFGPLWHKQLISYPTFRTFIK